MCPFSLSCAVLLGAASSSSRDDSDPGLVSEEDATFQHSSKHSQQHRQPSPADSATASGSTAAAAAVGGAVDSQALPTAADREAVLLSLHSDVKKAGGSLAPGWTVRLSGRTPTGNWRTKHFIEPGTNNVFTGMLAVKRHLGLAPPVSKTGGWGVHDPVTAPAGVLHSAWSSCNC